MSTTNSSALPKSEKIIDSKFISASTGQPALREPSNKFLADKHELQAKKLYNNLPKHTQALTASMSFCHHTNTKLVMGTSFNNIKELTTYIRSAHPIFSPEIPLLTLLKIYGKSKTVTERYIAMTSILVKTRIINTDDCGLHLESNHVDFLKPAFDALVTVIHQALSIEFKVAVNTLVIRGDSQSDYKRLHTQIKESAQAIDSATYNAGGVRLLAVDHQTTKQLKLDDEVALEQELTKILTNYEGTKGNKYTPQLNRWVRRTLTRSDMTLEQTNMTMKIINSKPDVLRTGTIEAILPLVEVSLCYDDDVSRRNSAMVLRHLNYMIELQLACLYTSGFVNDIVREEVRSDKAMTIYAAKTKIEEDAAIAKISASVSPALLALRKRMGVK